MNKWMNETDWSLRESIQDKEKKEGKQKENNEGFWKKTSTG